MAWTRYQMFLCILMIVTGTINTMSNKWADYQKSVGVDGTEHDFNHPFVQTFVMFIGEMSCLLAARILYAYYKRKDYTDDQMPVSISGNRDFNPLIFGLPMLCDFTSTSLMNIGLILTTPSSFQMLRGSVIVFTALFAAGFLGRKIKKYEIFGIFLVIAGLVIVGVADLTDPDQKSSKFGLNGVLTGDLLIISGQVLTATQFIVEEKFIVGKGVAPLKAVGWEGALGVILILILFLPMYYIPVGHTIFDNPNGGLEDVVDALYQMKNNKIIIIGLIGNLVSISFFNFAGVSVTQQLSAPTRSVLDSIRTIFIKCFGIWIGWEKYNNIQLIGFIILILGMFVYNDIIIRPFFNRLRNRSSSTTQLFVEEENDHVPQRSES